MARDFRITLDKLNKDLDDWSGEHEHEQSQPIARETAHVAIATLEVGLAIAERLEKMTASINNLREAIRSKP